MLVQESETGQHDGKDGTGEKRDEELKELETEQEHEGELSSL